MLQPTSGSGIPLSKAHRCPSVSQYNGNAIRTLNATCRCDRLVISMLDFNSLSRSATGNRSCFCGLHAYIINIVTALLSRTTFTARPDLTCRSHAAHARHWLEKHRNWPLTLRSVFVWANGPVSIFACMRLTVCKHCSVHYIAATNVSVRARFEWVDASLFLLILRGLSLHCSPLMHSELDCRHWRRGCWCWRKQCDSV